MLKLEIILIHYVLQSIGKISILYIYKGPLPPFCV